MQLWTIVSIDTIFPIQFGLLLEPYLPERKGQWGGIAHDNRRFINAVFWILHTEAPWRDLPPSFGKWGTVHHRFRRRKDEGLWEKLPDILIDKPDYDWHTIDASPCKVHPYVTGEKSGNQEMSHTKGCSTQKFTLP